MPSSFQLLNYCYSGKVRKIIIGKFALKLPFNKKLLPSCEKISVRERVSVKVIPFSDN